MSSFIFHENWWSLDHLMTHTTCLHSEPRTHFPSATWCFSRLSTQEYDSLVWYFFCFLLWNTSKLQTLLEKWLSCKQYWMLLQRTQVQFPARIWWPVNSSSRASWCPFMASIGTEHVHGTETYRQAKHPNTLFFFVKYELFWEILVLWRLRRITSSQVWD